jgi:hypothetical protein
MGRGGSDNYAQEAAADEARRQREIEQGTAQVRGLFQSQFTPSYFEGLEQDYLDYYKPQLNDQVGDANEGLLYQLARSGHLDSSVRIDKQADL